MAADLPLDHVSVSPESSQERPPAVILLHGRGADEEDLLGLADQLPDELHVLSVRAPYELGPGYTWYEIDLSAGGLHASQPDPEDYTDSLDRLTRFVDGAVAEYDLDPDGVGLLGFSQGAILSLGAMVDRPSGFQWIVALHGYLPGRYDEDDLAPAAGTPVFVGAGTQDEVIPSTRAEDGVDRLEAAGIDVTFRTYPIGHGIAPDELRDVTEWLGTRLGTGADSEAV